MTLMTIIILIFQHTDLEIVCKAFVFILRNNYYSNTSLENSLLKSQKSKITQKSLLIDNSG